MAAGDLDRRPVTTAVRLMRLTTVPTASSHCRAASLTVTPASRSLTALRRRSFKAASGNFRQSIFSIPH
jgi:hypothetical protein